METMKLTKKRSFSNRALYAKLSDTRPQNPQNDIDKRIFFVLLWRR